jgi:hypothetical protein
VPFRPISPDAAGRESAHPAASKAAVIDTRQPTIDTLVPDHYPEKSK